MCGIAGILNKNNHGVTEDLILMLSCMHNRGPDGVAIQVGEIDATLWSLLNYLVLIQMEDLAWVM